MSDFLKSTWNYRDKSNQDGFEFEFLCECCGQAFRSRFQAYRFSKISGVADKVDDFLGQRVAEASERARNTAWEQARDQAFVGAVKEMEAFLTQCPTCLKSVCLEKCWQERLNLCQTCVTNPPPTKVAPLVGCPVCGAGQSPTATFCSECGCRVKPVALNLTCLECGAELQDGAKFCADCGARV